MNNWNQENDSSLIYINDKRKYTWPRNWLRIIMILFIVLCLSYSSYFLLEIRDKIPSRNQTKPPQLFINEGEYKCFGKDSMWFSLQHSTAHIEEDALYMGGTDPKHIIVHNSSFIAPIWNTNQLRAMWKPQLPIFGRHKASAQNEVLFFHLDCVLNLRRTPPATIFPLDPEELERSLTDSSIALYTERNTSWEHWKLEGNAWGTSQIFWPKVKTENPVAHLGSKILKTVGLYNLVASILGSNGITEREFSQKDMIDFIAGNWDRGHNQFFVFDSLRESNEIIYLDHNHLRTNKEGPNPFTLTSCKYYKDNVLRLQQLTSNNLTKIVQDSIIEHEPHFVWDSNIIAPVEFLQKRALIFLEHVNDCVTEYGEKYVFEY